MILRDFKLFNSKLDTRPKVTLNEMSVLRHNLVENCMHCNGASLVHVHSSLKSVIRDLIKKIFAVFGEWLYAINCFYKLLSFFKVNIIIALGGIDPKSWTCHSSSRKLKLCALFAIMSPMWVETHRQHVAWPIIGLRAWPFIRGSLCKLSLFYINHKY